MFVAAPMSGLGPGLASEPKAAVPAPAVHRRSPGVAVSPRQRLHRGRIWEPKQNLNGTHPPPARMEPGASHRRLWRPDSPDHDRSAVDPLRSTSSSQVHAPGLVCERVKTKPPDSGTPRRPAPPHPFIMVADFFRAAHNFRSRLPDTLCSAAPHSPESRNEKQMWRKGGTRNHSQLQRATEPPLPRQAIKPRIDGKSARRWCRRSRTSSTARCQCCAFALSTERGRSGSAPKDC